MDILDFLLILGKNEGFLKVFCETCFSGVVAYLGQKVGWAKIRWDFVTTQNMRGKLLIILSDEEAEGD